ncbi:MAG: SpoIIE family protein phosphatase [Acidimicrobiales bacterium]
MARRLLSTGLGLFTVVLAGYVAGSSIAFWLADRTGLAAAFFPPAGITVGALLTVPRQRWPWVLAAAVVGELTMDLRSGLGLAESIGFVAANSLEPLAGAALVRWAVPERLDLSIVRHLIGYVGGAVVGGPAVGAALGAAAAVGFGDNGYLSTVGQWWLGDALGVLLIATIIIAWQIPPQRRRRHGRWAWSVLLAVATAGAVVGILARTDMPLLFLALTGIVVSGALFGVRAAAATAMVAAVAAGLWIPFETGGLFAGLDPGTALVIIKLKFLVFETSGLLVGAELAERERLTETAVEMGQEAVLQRATVERLQRLLLPPEHQTGRAFEAAGLYIAATTELGVGGDWYESTDLPDGRVFVAVGDIVGHGAVAAASMGRLRVLANVCALEATDAADLLRRLEARASWMVDAFASTAWFGLFDPATRLLSFASAGHPPAYLVGNEAGLGPLTEAPEAAGTVRVRQLVCSPNVPLLVRPGGLKAGAVVRLPPGATLVVYTDGLIERRGETLDAGMGRLEAVLHDLAVGPVRPDRVWATMEERVGSPSDDDTIVLTVTFR